MSALGEDLSEKELDEMMKEADADGSGTIDCECKTPCAEKDCSFSHFLPVCHNAAQVLFTRWSL